MLNVKIQITDVSKGLNSEIELSEADNLSKLVIIQNVFKLFGVDNNIMDTVNTFNNAGKAYKSFFEKVKPIEPIEPVVKDNKIIATDLKESLIKNHESLKNTYKSKDDSPDYYRTGIKVDSNSSPRYKLRYKCDKCHDNGIHYVYANSKFTWCHSCDHKLIVKPAIPKYHRTVVKQEEINESYRDSLGNFFIAGNYRDTSLNW
ncbi:hypothetical protein EBB07_28115 [Paenibacillaceae bacterium]|nr:hypothetical protein EBB07_28115 [Paenibacillaceae bacterium]